MKPFYWAGTTNFGDYLNSWLWPRLLGNRISSDSQVRLVGIGSLLKDTLNFVQGRKVIFGTGSGYGAIPSPKVYQDWLFYFVRGPLTAGSFQLSDEKAIVDGAWLIGLLPEYSRPPTEKSGIAFIPHWTTADSGNWQQVCARAGFKYVDPMGELSGVLNSLATSELVVTESLHGAILADLFRTPWIPVCISPKFLPFKWADWFQSVELEPKMRNLPLSDMFEYLYCGVSRKNINYDPTEYSFAASPAASKAEDGMKEPGPLYSYKIRLKRNLRNARRVAVQSCKVARNIYPLSAWNERHQSKLAKTLANISQSTPCLSSDRTRDTRLAQLAEVTSRLKSDYDSGRLSG